MSEYAARNPQPHDPPAAASERASPPRRPARARRRRPASPIEWLIVLLTLAALVALGAMAALLLGERGYADRIYPHITVRGLDIGGMRTASARAAIERRYAAFLNNPVALSYGDQGWWPTAEDLGLQLDIDGAVATAATIGRTTTRLDNARTVAATWEQGVELPLRLVIDQTAIQRYLLGMAAAVERPPRNAAVHLEGSTVVVTPEEFGVQLLIDETLRDITAAAQGLEPQPVNVRTRLLAPQVRDADVAPLVEEARTLLNGPIVLSGAAGSCARGCRWQWSPDQIARWIALQPTVAADGRPSATLTVDHAAIRQALLPIADALREDGGLPRVAWNGGDLRIVEPGTAGRGLDVATALAQIDRALRGGERTIQLPLIALQPPVTAANLASLGISGEIGTGISSFSASQQYRITNIRAGARRMNGLLVPPGVTFSFNDNLGAVDASNGFVEGSAIVDNRTQKEWGGGLCQVSTTMFRAAFWAGLPIAERHEHAFRIGWYEELGEPPGLDAAIFTPYSDLRFTNDTGGWLLIQTAVDLRRQRLIISLYGTPTGREVTMSHRVIARTPAPAKPLYVDDPELPRGTFKKTDFARGGMKVEVYRTVRAGGQILARDTFPTEFKPWPDIFVRGTGGAR